MRQVGTTTRQMRHAPFNSVYVWCNSKLDYPRDLARHLNRPDLKIVPPIWVRPQNLRGSNIGPLTQGKRYITLDHAITPNDMTKEQYALVNACFRPEGEAV